MAISLGVYPIFIHTHSRKEGPDCELVVLGVAVSTDADVVHLQNVITWLRGEKRSRIPSAKLT
jgi:hypothetical protein